MNGIASDGVVLIGLSDLKDLCIGKIRRQQDS